MAIGPRHTWISSLPEEASLQNAENARDTLEALSALRSAVETAQETADDAAEAAESAGGGAVSSVFGRTGAVVAAASDYVASEVDNDSGVAGSTVADALDQLDSDIGAITGGGWQSIYDQDFTALANATITAGGSFAGLTWTTTNTANCTSIANTLGTGLQITLNANASSWASGTYTGPVVMATIDQISGYDPTKDTLILVYVTPSAALSGTQGYFASYGDVGGTATQMSVDQMLVGHEISGGSGRRRWMQDTTQVTEAIGVNALQDVLGILVRAHSPSFGQAYEGTYSSGMPATTALSFWGQWSDAANTFTTRTESGTTTGTKGIVLGAHGTASSGWGPIFKHIKIYQK